MLSIISRWEERRGLWDREALSVGGPFFFEFFYVWVVFLGIVLTGHSPMFLKEKMGRRIHSGESILENFALMECCGVW